MAIAVFVGLVSVTSAVYQAMASPSDEATLSFAAALPADAPLYVELSLPRGALDDEGSMFTESRLLTEAGRAEINEIWPRIVDATLLPEEGIESLRSIRRMAFLPVDDLFSFDYMGGAVIAFEFDSPEACTEFVRAAELAAEEYRLLEAGGKAILLIAEDASEQELEEVAANLREPHTDNLAASSAFQETLKVKQDEGLFVYSHMEQNWPETRAQLRDELRYMEPFSQMEDHLQRRFMRGLDEVLAPDQMGATGFWLGLDELEAAQPVGDAPLYDSGLFGRTDDSLLGKLPAETSLLMQFALFEEKASEVLAHLEKHCPNLWRFAVEALEENPEHLQWQAILDRAGAFGDTLTGQFVFGLAVIEGELNLVFAAGIEDRDGMLAAIEREAELDGAEESLDLEERDDLLVIFEERDVALFFDEDSLVWLTQPTMGHWGAEDEFEWQARSKAHSLNSALEVYMVQHNGLGDLPEGSHGLDELLPDSEMPLYEKLGFSEYDFWGLVQPEHITLTLHHAPVIADVDWEIRVDSDDPELEGVNFYLRRGVEGQLRGLPEPEPAKLIATYREHLAEESFATSESADKLYQGIERGASFVFGMNVRQLMLDTEDEFQTEEELELQDMLADEWLSFSSAYDGNVSRTRANIGLQDLAVIGIAMRRELHEIESRARWRDAMEIGETLRASLDAYLEEHGEIEGLFTQSFNLDEPIIDEVEPRTLLELLELSAEDLGDLTYFPPEAIVVHLVPPFEEDGEYFFEIEIQGGFHYDAPPGYYVIDRHGNDEVHHGWHHAEPDWTEDEWDDWENGEDGWDEAEDWDEPERWDPENGDEESD